MSEIRMSYKRATEVMTDLVERATLPDVPHRAHWWRLRVFPNPDGAAYEMHIDNMDNPTQITVRWGDAGCDEHIEPYAARIADDHDDYPDLGRDSLIRALPYAKIWLDVLSGDAPTSNPRWEALTEPGDHRHPDDLEEIARGRAELGLLPMWAVGLGGKAMTDSLDELERRVCEKWVTAAATRIPEWTVPEFDMSSWAGVVKTPLPPGTQQFPREQWASYPNKRTYALLLADRMLDFDMTDEQWMQLCMVMQYGGKTRLS